MLKTDAHILGICYGMYVVATHLGAKTPPSKAREYGPAMLQIDAQDQLFEGLEGREHRVWMSHGDRVEALPSTLRSIAHTENAPCAAVRSNDGRIRGILPTSQKGAYAEAARNPA